MFRYFKWYTLVSDVGTLVEVIPNRECLNSIKTLKIFLRTYFRTFQLNFNIFIVELGESSIRYSSST